MNIPQEEHLQKIKDKFAFLVDQKYRIGAQEHGGNLWEKSPRWTSREARNEALDLFVYLYDTINWIDVLVERIKRLEEENARLKNENL